MVYQSRSGTKTRAKSAALGREEDGRNDSAAVAFPHVERIVLSLF
jgi:hypothetical protein